MRFLISLIPSRIVKQKSATMSYQILSTSTTGIIWRTVKRTCTLIVALIERLIVIVVFVLLGPRKFKLRVCRNPLPKWLWSQVSEKIFAKTSRQGLSKEDHRLSLLRRQTLERGQKGNSYGACVRKLDNLVHTNPYLALCFSFHGVWSGSITASFVNGNKPLEGGITRKLAKWPSLTTWRFHCCSYFGNFQGFKDLYGTLLGSRCLFSSKSFKFCKTSNLYIKPHSF